MQAGGAEPALPGSSRSGPLGGNSVARRERTWGSHYIGRFAPSPTGPLHAGSLVAALASWLDARAHGGLWLVRIEDVDAPRCVAGVDLAILQQLKACGLVPDAPPLYQSGRTAHYAAALNQLLTAGAAYPCACTRQDIDDTLQASGQLHQRHGERVYPGTCRHGLQGRVGRAWRFNTAFFIPKILLAQAFASCEAIDSGAPAVTRWVDLRLGPQAQNVERAVGDFVLQRADGLFAYQLAVVVDDAAQGVTQVVRGEDLADNTARQILLQRTLGLLTPGYLHTPLVLAADGQKLSKQNGAQPLDTSNPMAALQRAGCVLGLPGGGGAASVGEWLAQATRQWAERYRLPA